MVSRVLLGCVTLLAGLAPMADIAPPAPPPAVHAAAAPLSGRPAQVFARTYPVMGTEATFSAYTADRAQAKRAFAAAYDEIRRVELQIACCCCHAMLSLRTGAKKPQS